MTQFADFNLDELVDELADQAEQQFGTELASIRQEQDEAAERAAADRQARDAADASVADAIAVLDGPMDFADFFDSLDQDGTDVGSLTLAFAAAVGRGEVGLRQTPNEFGELRSEDQVVFPIQ